jgi:hypothetical protein
MNKLPTVKIRLEHIGRERAQKVQMLQHGVVAFMLLLAGIESFGSSEILRRILSVLDILVGTLVISTIAKEFRRSRERKHSGIHWPEVAAAILLATEGVHKLAEGQKHYPLGICYLIAGAATLVIALRYDRLRGFRRMELSNSGLFVRMSPFRSFSVNWADVRSIRIGSSGIEVTLKDDVGLTIDMKPITNRDEALGKLKEYLDRYDLLPEAERKPR